MVPALGLERSSLTSFRLGQCPKFETVGSSRWLEVTKRGKSYKGKYEMALNSRLVCLKLLPNRTCTHIWWTWKLGHAWRTTSSPFTQLLLVFGVSSSGSVNLWQHLYLFVHCWAFRFFGTCSSTLNVLKIQRLCVTQNTVLQSPDCISIDAIVPTGIVRGIGWKISQNKVEGKGIGANEYGRKKII